MWKKYWKIWKKRRKNAEHVMEIPIKTPPDFPSGLKFRQLLGRISAVFGFRTLQTSSMMQSSKMHSKWGSSVAKFKSIKQFNGNYSVC